MPAKPIRDDADLLLTIKDNQEFLDRLAEALTPRDTDVLELDHYPRLPG